MRLTSASVVMPQEGVGYHVTQSPKTHRGLIAAFGQFLVLGGHLSADLGSALSKVERLRLLADYTGDPISTEDSAWAVEQATVFVKAVRRTFDLDL